jgi:hypothetical protein
VEYQPQRDGDRANIIHNRDWNIVSETSSRELQTSCLAYGDARGCLYHRTVDITDRGPFEFPSGARSLHLDTCKSREIFEDCDKKSSINWVPSHGPWFWLDKKGGPY